MWRWLLVTGSDMGESRAEGLSNAAESKPVPRTLPSGRDGGEPAAVFLAFSRDGFEERFLNARGDRAALALADRAPVELTNRSHFGRGPGEECFVGDVEIVARDAAC